MRKYKKLTLIIAVLIVGAALFLYFEQQATNKRIVKIPKQKTVSSIKFYKYSNSDCNEINDKHVISEIYSALLQARRCYTKESISDVPVNVEGNVTSIVIKDENNDEVLLFAYKSEDGKYYIEKPYQSIHEITAQYYNALVQYCI